MTRILSMSGILRKAEQNSEPLYRDLAKDRTQMRRTIPLAVLAAMMFGCASTPPAAPQLHDKAHQARLPYVDIAVNTGFERARDVESLYDSLASEGMRCGLRAMSCNAEQIVVERADSDRAKTIITGIIIRDKLTVRVYTSPDFDKAPASSPLEVWVGGQKVREETYKL